MHGEFLCVRSQLLKYGTASSGELFTNRVHCLACAQNTKTNANNTEHSCMYRKCELRNWPYVGYMDCMVHEIECTGCATGFSEINNRKRNLPSVLLLCDCSGFNKRRTYATLKICVTFVRKLAAVFIFFRAVSQLNRKYMNMSYY